MHRQQLVYILIALVVGAIGFAIGMAFIPDKWSDSWNREAKIHQVFFFQAEFVEKGVLKSGWSRPKDWGTWSKGKKSTLVIDLDEPHDGDLELEFEFRPFFAGAHQSQRVELSVNGTLIDTWKLSPAKQKWSQRRVRIAKNIWNAIRPAEINFVYSEPKSPKELGVSKDRRRLAIGLKTLTIHALF